MKIGSPSGMCSWGKALAVIQCMKQIDFAISRLNLITIRFLFTRQIDQDDNNNEEDDNKDDDMFIKCIIYKMMCIFL